MTARPRVGVMRLDSVGDVLLAGPAVRALAYAGCDVVFVASEKGAAAARLLPEVVEVLVVPAPWIDVPPRDWAPGLTASISSALRSARLDELVVLTSFHQSALPAAVVAREAGLRRISAVSEDYPGSLLDVRVRPDASWHEVERNLAVVSAAGYPVPHDTRLAVRSVSLPSAVQAALPDEYVVVHPGASVPARAATPSTVRQIVACLAASGRRVVVTGNRDERALTAVVAGADGVDLGGGTTLPQLAEVVRRAEAVIVGNTGPAHLAAAVGTPVAALFSPVVPWHQWRPWHVPTLNLGATSAPCAGTRARQCPVPATHPCLAVDPHEVVRAVDRLAAPSRARVGAR